MQYCLQLATEAEVLSCSANHLVGQQRKHWSRIVKIMPLWFLVSWQRQVHAWKMQHDIDGKAEPAAGPHTRHICALYYAAEG